MQRAAALQRSLSHAGQKQQKSRGPVAVSLVRAVGAHVKISKRLKGSPAARRVRWKPVEISNQRELLVGNLPHRQLLLARRCDTSAQPHTQPVRMARIAAIALCCSSAAALSSPAAGLQAQTAAPARAAVAAAPEPFLKDFTRPMCPPASHRQPSVVSTGRRHAEERPVRKFRRSEKNS